MNDRSESDAVINYICKLLFIKFFKHICILKCLSFLILTRLVVRDSTSFMVQVESLLLYTTTY